MGRGKDWLVGGMRQDCFYHQDQRGVRAFVDSVQEAGAREVLTEKGKPAAHPGPAPREAGGAVGLGQEASPSEA